MNRAAATLLGVLAGAKVALGDCPAAPITTADQAICLATKYLHLTEADLKKLRPTVIRNDGSWRVSFNDPEELKTPHVGGPGGEATIDSATGKVIDGGMYQ